MQGLQIRLAGRVMVWQLQACCSSQEAAAGHACAQRLLAAGAAATGFALAVVTWSLPGPDRSILT